MSRSSSAVVDTKVAELQLDNTNFEQNAATTISTVQKLQKALDFSVSKDSFKDVTNSLRKVNPEPLTAGMNTLKRSMDSLADTVGFAAVVRYTNQALDAVERLVKAMTIDQVSAGWQKYADKTTSVATLVAQGYELENVNAQLERLNWFTDETSYNFTEMVANIAKFTATGQGLEESVTAMEGIATWAALSGQNANKASQAMYQLSQAMGAGVMRKEDYKSIQNVSMDTDEFRQKALDAAVALGTLKATGKDTYASLVADSKAGKEEFTKSQFAESLTQGQWFTKDVMMRVFNDYSAAVNQIYEYAEERGITASEAMAEAADQFDEFGLKAFQAAQEARSWGDVVDSVKDAVSTSFMNMFEIIFGDYEQATSLWTAMANGLYDVIVEPINEFNDVLEGAFGTADKIVDLDEWNKLGLSEAQATGLAKALKGVAEEAGVAFEEGNLQSFLDTLDDGWLTADKFKEALSGFDGSNVEESTKSLEELHDVALKVIKGDYGNGQARIDKLTQEGFDAKKVQAYVNELHKLTGGTWNITDAIMAEADANTTLEATLKSKSDEELIALGYTEEEVRQLRDLQKVAEETGKPLNELFNSEENMTGRERLIHNLTIALEGISRIAGTVREAFFDIFPPATSTTIRGLIDGVGTLSNAFNDFTKKHENDFRNIFEGIFAAVDIVIRVVTQFVGTTLRVLGKGIEKLKLIPFLGKIGEIVKGIRGWIVENQIIEKTFGFIENSIKAVVHTIEGWIDTFKQIPQVKEIIDSFSESFGWIKTNFGSILDTAGTKLGEFKDNVKLAFKDTKTPEEFFSNIQTAFSSLWKEITSSETFAKIKGAFEQIGTSIRDYFYELGNNDDGTRNTFGNLLDTASKFKADIIKLFSGTDENGEKINFFETIKDAFSNAWEGISESGVVEKISGAFTTLRQTIDNFFTNLGTNQNGETNLFGKIWIGIKDAFKVIESKVLSAKDAVHKFFEENQLGQTFAQVVDDISGGFTQFFSNIPGFISEAKVRFLEFSDRVSKSGGLAFNNIGNIWSAFKDTILDFLTTSDLFKPLIDGFSSAFETIATKIYEFGINKDGTKNLFGNFLDIDGAVFDGIWTTFNTVKTGIIEFVTSLPGFFSGLVPAFQDFFDKVREVGGVKLGNVGEIFQAFKDSVGQYFKDSSLFDPIATAFETIKEDIKQRLEDAGINVDSLQEKFQNFVDTIKEAWKDFQEEGPLGALLKLFTGDTAKASEVGEDLEKSGSGFSIFYNFIKDIKPDTILKVVASILALKSLTGVVGSLKQIAGAVSNFFNAGATLQKTQADDITRQGKATAWLKIAGSIALIAFAIYKVGTLDVGAIEQGAIVVGAIAAAFLAFNWLADKLIGGADMKGIGEGLSGFAMAIAIVAIVASAVAAVPWDVLKTGLKKVALIGGLLLVATLALGLIGRVGGKNALDSVNALDKFVSIVEKISVMVAVISAVPWDILQTGLQKMAVIMGAMLVPLLALAVVGRIAGEKTTAPIAAMTIMLGALAGVFYLLGKYGDVDKYETIANSLGEVLLALSGMMAASKFAGPIGGFTAALNLVEFIGTIVLVLGAIRELGKAFGNNDLLGDMGDLLGKLGEGLGKLIGGIGAGMAVKFGEVPEETLDKIFSFIDKIASIDIKPQKIKESAGLFGESSSIDQSITTFASGLAGILSAVNNISVSDVNGDLEDKVKYFEDIVSFVNGLAAIEIPVQTIEEATGPWGWFGSSSVDQSLSTFAEGMQGVVSAVNGVTAENTDNLDEKRAYLEEIVKFTGGLAAIEIPQQSIESKIGPWGWFGSANIDASLSKFAEGIQGVLNAVASVTPDDTSNLGAKSRYLEEVARFTGQLAAIEIPQQTIEEATGPWGWFGSSNVDQSLSKFAEGIQGVLDAVKSVTPDDTTSLGDKVKYLDEVAKFTGQLAAIEIPQQTIESKIGPWGWFGSANIDASLSKFAEGMDGVLTAVGKVTTKDTSGLDEKASYFEIVGGFVERLAGIKIPEQTSSFSKWDGFFKGESGASDSSLVTFATGMTEVAKALNTMVKPSVSLEDVTLMANCVKTMATAAGNIPEFKAGISRWFEDNTLDGFAEQMKNAAPNLVAASESASGIDAGNLAAMTEGITGVMGVISAIKADGNVDASAYSDDVQIIGDYGRLITEIGTAFSSFDGIQNFNVDDIMKIPDIIDALKKVSEGLEEIQTWGGEIADEDNPFLKLGLYVQALSTIGTDLSGISGVVEAFTSLNTIDLDSGDIYNTEIVTTLSTNIETLKTMISSLSSLDTSGVDKFTSALDKINSADIQKASEKLGEAKASGEATGAEVSKSIVGGLDSSGIGSGISAALSSAMSGIDTSGFTQVGTSIMAKIGLGIINAASNIKDSISSAVDSAKRSADSKASGFESAGKNFSAGLARGIGANKSAAINAAIDVAARALEAAKSRLQIASPSKEMERVGMFFDLGFARGLNKFSNDVYDESTSVANAAIEGLSLAVSMAGDILSEDDINSPVITPVLDLSQVQTGASGIGHIFDTSPVLAPSFGAIGMNAEAIRQQGQNADILNALTELGGILSSRPGDTYNVNGVTYDDGSNVSSAVRELIRAAKIERRA